MIKPHNLFNIARFIYLFIFASSLQTIKTHPHDFFKDTSTLSKLEHSSSFTVHQHTTQ